MDRHLEASKQKTKCQSVKLLAARIHAMGRESGAMDRKGGAIQGGDRAPQYSRHANSTTTKCIAIEGDKTLARRLDVYARRLCVRVLNDASFSAVFTLK